MFSAVTMSNSTSLSEEASASSGTRAQDLSCLNNMFSDVSPDLQPQKIKKKRNLPGNPDPDSEVIALSPRTLMATNRFICEICNKGFQRDQNLQLHRRGHNLPWKLRQRNSKEIIRRKVYVCPEPLCVHHHPSRALGDLTGIKKHFCRKHGEKKWKCEKCSKRYAVQSDYKAHSKTCGTREYKCDCGTIFSRKDSFITHRAFCDALAQESARLSTTQLTSTNPLLPDHISALHLHHNPSSASSSSSSSSSSLFPNFSTSLITSWDPNQNPNNNNNVIHNISSSSPISFFQSPLPPPHNNNKPNALMITVPSSFLQQQEHEPEAARSSENSCNMNNTAHLYSATALLEKAANIGAVTGSNSSQQTRSVGHMASSSSMNTRLGFGISDHHHHHYEYPAAAFSSGHFATWQKSDRLTRDFLGLTGSECSNVREHLLSNFPGAVDHHHHFSSYDRDHSVLKPSAFGLIGENWGEIAEGGQNVIS